MKGEVKRTSEPQPAQASPPQEPLRFFGGTAGALTPFALFLAGVIWLGLSGAPDERGFWPVLLAALSLGLLLARDRERYCEAMLAGMSRPLVMLMVLAWLFAGVLAVLLQASGFVDALVWLASFVGLSGAGFVVAAFLICCAVSTATGTSLGTLLLCAPLLYPAAASLGAPPAVLIGAILAGATFGDNLSPVSDSTIASASTQGADLGGVVRSRLRYALPAAAVALVAYLLVAWTPALPSRWTAMTEGAPHSGGPGGLPMLLAPAVTLVLLLCRRHLLEGLLAGIAAAVAVGLATGRLAPTELLYIDPEEFGARGLLVDGLGRGLGVSVFTLLLMALIATLDASGLVDRLVGAAERRTRSRRGAEAWIVTAAASASALTTHSVVALLTVGPFARRSGERFGIGPYRRANLLDVTVCTLPFLLPYCIPTILAASLTRSGADAGLPQLGAWTAGLYNFHSWALLAVLLVAVLTGWGAKERSSRCPGA